ncbi:MAG: NAD(P)-binding protein [Verrucomicrobiaceae bacterium]|nr:NAD(P)-binding protein [Verrucomicrobiaceae bacterium]
MGAGCSGLAAVWALRQTSAQVIIFEQRRRFPERTATGSARDCHIAIGISDFQTETAGVSNLSHRQIPIDDLNSIGKHDSLFSQIGEVAPSNALLDSEPKLNYRLGIKRKGLLGRH